MKKIIIAITWIFILCFLASCAAKVTPVRPTTEGPLHIIDKNYEINKPQSAYVGEEIIHVKDHWVESTTQKKMKSLNDFKIELHATMYSGSEDNTYVITSKGMHEDTKIYFIEIPGLMNTYGINEYGKWHGFFAGKNRLFETAAVIKPQDTKFELVKETIYDLLEGRGFMNYEILFTGTTADSMNFLYREYTAEDLARPAFHQNLTYPIDTEIIRFRQTRIKIHEVSSESIKYTVLEDGLSE